MNFTALKNTVNEIIPEGYEPWSDFHPEEEVSSIIASNSILKRMTPSILLTALGNKCIIELKRELEKLWKKGGATRREDMMKMIIKFFNAFDKTGANTKKYRSLFEPMSDAQFNNYFKGFFADEMAYLILDIVDYERTITLEDIERAAKSINIPLFEHVYMPHLSMDKENVIGTTTPVPVGYVPIKRTQQTVMKKNGISTNIDKRSAITAQVTGADKNGRESDLENTMLVSQGMEYTLRELNGPRADDLIMKQQMLQQIALNGYVSIDDLEDDVLNKTTLNTVNTYFIGMGLQTDLVMKGLMLPSTLKKDL